MLSHCRSALIHTFWRDWLYIAIIAILAECVGIYQANYIKYLANFITDLSQPYTKGILLVVLFLLMNLFVILFRNRYIQFGYMTSIRMRRTLCAVLFDKVTMLSV